MKIFFMLLSICFVPVLSHPILKIDTEQKPICSSQYTSKFPLQLLGIVEGTEEIIFWIVTHYETYGSRTTTILLHAINSNT